MDATAIVKRIDELLALPESRRQTPDRKPIHNMYSEMLQGTTGIFDMVYGRSSAQLATLQESIKSVTVNTRGMVVEAQLRELSYVIAGALENVKRDIDAGLIGSLSQQITGDVLTDFIQLARTTLNQNGDDAKNVAAVLAAAAFEDTIRRMGANLAGISDQRDLADVLIALKEKGVIQSPQIGIAQSYLSFRNHALHANWDKVQRESVHSVLGFVEQLLLKHFH
jgi:hypothetical protein